MLRLRSLKSVWNRQMRIACVVSLAAMAAESGCGVGRPKRVPIPGQVLLDCKPLDYGFVEFFADNSRPSMGKLDEQGRFSLTCYELNDDAIVGTNRIAVTAREPLTGNRVR